MKKSYISTFVTAAAVLVLAVGCDKDNSYDGMKLIAEGFGSAQKVAVSGTASSWVSGETLRINGADKTIAVDGEGNAYINSVNAADTYRAIYPASLNSSAPLNADAVTVTLPASYQWAVDANGRQLIASPMAAFGTSSSRLYFRHITSAIDVKITNYYGFTVTVDNVTVSSDAYQLSGSKDITLNSTEALAVNAATTETAADKQVQVLFDDNELQILAGQTKTVQVPVLPVGAGNHFTVSITVHKVGDAAVTKTLTKTQTTGGAMPRNSLATAPDTVGALFSVAADKKVIISQGNLQYNITTGVWSFMDNQYDINETQDQDVGVNYANLNIVSLFGWGASGWNNGNNYYLPYNTARTYAASYGYGPKNGDTYTYDLTGEFANADWGYNTISNGGTGWRTLATNATSGGEWNYLLKSRTTKYKVNSYTSVRYAKAFLLSSIHGIILFPDTYTHPDGVAEPTGINKDDATSWDANTYTLEEWRKMEAEGAVFLPAAGTRSDNTNNTTVTYVNTACDYWTATNGGSNNFAFSFRVTNTTLSVKSSWGKNQGKTVRLVKDVE